MTRQNGSIIGEQTLGPNQPGMWVLNDAQERSQQGDWGTGLGTIRYLVVGGGGGGGGARPSEINAGGGGAGGVIAGTEILYEGRRYNINVGSGGNGAPGYDPGARGNESDFNTPSSYAPGNYPGTSFEHKSYGGGGGRGYDTKPQNPQHGASGGGASSNPGPNSAGGGLNPNVGQPTSSGNMPTPYANSNFPNWVPGTTQGYPGGQNAAPPSDRGGGGGGGAGGIGGNASSQSGGSGGIGFQSDITGSDVYYAGGGGGGGPTGGGSGGLGGGGAGGGPVPTSDAKAGNDATYYGGGGGGAATRPGNPPSSVNGGNGFSGIVIIRYPNAFELDLSSCPTAPTEPTNPYGLKIVDQGVVGGDTYIAFGSPAPQIKFIRK